MTKEKLQFFVQGNRHVFLPPSCLNHHVTTSLGFSLLREKQGRRPNRPTKLLHAYLACEVCETRTVCKRHANKLTLFHLNCLFNRKLLKITQRDKVPDTKVVSLAGLLSIHTQCSKKHSLGRPAIQSECLTHASPRDCSMANWRRGNTQKVEKRSVLKRC